MLNYALSGLWEQWRPRLKVVDLIGSVLIKMDSSWFDKWKEIHTTEKEFDGLWKKYLRKTHK